LVGKAGGRKGGPFQSLRLNDLLGGAPTLGDIAQNHGVANLFTVTGGGNPAHCSAKRSSVSISGVGDSSHSPSLAVFDHQRHDVKINKAICRIKNFHVATDRPAALGKRLPIKAADALVEAFPDGMARAKPKQLTGCIVKIS